jgi:protocatechuate 3,4-dioxygenase beta subunit
MMDIEVVVDANACAVSQSETTGPSSIKTPTQLVRENIVGNRAGVPLLINIKVENTNDSCVPLEGVLVDIWHYDAKENYSEYHGQLDGDFTSENFLRGRQTTNAQGVVSFISVYPGWYPGRAPHLHLEILRANGTSLLVTQTAFPEDISNTVYATNGYNGNFDTSNSQDGEFGNSLNRNLATSVTGNTADGYTLEETIKVAF